MITYSSYSGYGTRRALTLIEVMTALAILSTLLVGMLMAFTRNAEQIRKELVLRRAVTATDAMLCRWAQEQRYPSVNGKGKVPDTEDLVWQTRVHASQTAGKFGLSILDLEIRPETAPARSPPILILHLPVPAVLRPAAEESVP